MTGSDPEMQEVTLSFLHPRGPSRSSVYPHRADILTAHISDIMTFVEPTTYTGRTCTLTDNEMDSATRALENHTWWKGLYIYLCVHVCKGKDRGRRCCTVCSKLCIFVCLCL